MLYITSSEELSFVDMLCTSGCLEPRGPNLPREEAASRGISEGQLASFPYGRCWKS